jgi:hypothetical protein
VNKGERDKRKKREKTGAGVRSCNRVGAVINSWWGKENRF